MFLSRLNCAQFKCTFSCCLKAAVEKTGFQQTANARMPATRGDTASRYIASERGRHHPTNIDASVQPGTCRLLDRLTETKLINAFSHITPVQLVEY